MSFSLEGIKRLIYSCSITCEVKLLIFKNEKKLIKALYCEKLTLDFDGPSPSISKERFLLTVFDEYSRFSSSFPRPDSSSGTLIA
ncbi:hypothetical protein CEXT_103801 [Caerostris extrusa]|uniref:Uncharacterized protein n=1 Tax=Caerostris extrusa TaxID=172846 RepID=A0AAV4QA25_CAEEX|nr:hypothetical protein CEXT_103801 [Caerostris extrusa]